VFVSTYLRGKRSVFYAGYRYTDDRGEYRFGTLRDGTYYLAVVGKPWYSERLREPASVLGHTGFPPTYYPNARDPRSATALQLKPGQEAIANFTLTPSVSSSLTVTPNPRTSAGVRLDLMFEGIAGS